MKFGVFVPLAGDFAEPTRAVQVAREAEGAGWDGVFVSDLSETSVLAEEADACIVAAAIAATTSRLQLGLVTPAADRRRPWVLARQSAVVDHLSNGRLVFGTGVGRAAWQEGLTAPDRGGHDEEEDLRTSLFEESLAVLLLCWSGEPVRHEGRWMQVDSPPFLPVPLQRPRIPVWVTAEWPSRSPLRRAAHLDGILPSFPGAEGGLPDVSDVRAVREELRNLGAPANHDLALRGVLGSSSAQESLEHLRKLENAGATWWLETVSAADTLASVSDRIAAGPPRKR